jgi:DNA-binding CsgD family transcriptional regulator
MLTEPVEYIPPVVDKARDEYAVVCDSDTGFTPGEERIYGQLLEFKTSKEIAEKPRVATNTIINHCQKIYRKCGGNSIHGLFLFARNRGGLCSP